MTRAGIPGVRNRIAAALLAAATLASAAPGLGADSRPATYSVAIEGTRFEPETLTVRPGDTVVWVNKDPFPHTATALTGSFDSKSIAPNKSWQYTPRKTGVFPYLCTLHPTMKATLRVQ